MDWCKELLNDKLHVDWWIFEGEVEKVFENFHESEEV